MYEGLYNVRKGLSARDAEAVGVMTAKLLLRWDEWQHRRVEEISFIQDDAATRDISLDFTLPHWFHEIRQTPLDKSKRQLVPLTFLRKRSLINFRLRDDCNCALPLLTRWQNAQVAEAVLMVLASKVLGGVNVPQEIRCDIRDLVGAMDGSNSSSTDKLFDPDELHSDLRSQLAADATFSSIAKTFEHSFLACSMIDIGRHRRKVVHLSYEELLIRNETVAWHKRLISLARGHSRDLLITAPRGSAPESSHVEVVAPDLLQIVDRRQVYRDKFGELKHRKQDPSGHQRAHFHFGHQGPDGAVTVTMIPASVTDIRLAALASALGFIAILVALLAAPDLRNGKSSVEAAAVILLSFTAAAGLFAGAKDGASNMVRELLWPVRLLSLTPVLWTFLAGLIVLTPLGVTATQLCFGLLAVLDLVCTVQLFSTGRTVTTPAHSEAIA